MSELRNTLHAYWAERKLIALIVVIATLTAGVSAALQPTAQSVSLAFAINRINQAPTTDYQYDGYYALLAADEYAQTVVSWFTTPSIIRELYDQAKIDPNMTTVNSLTGRFKVKKYSAQNIVVKFSEPDETRAKALAGAIQTTLVERTERLNRTADDKAQFEIVTSAPVIAPAKPSPILWGAVALILSAGLAVLVAAMRIYLRRG